MPIDVSEPQDPKSRNPPPAATAKPSARSGRATVSFWCPEILIQEIDKRAAELQQGKIARVHRSDVIKLILAKEFGIDPSMLE